jgi:hypothetical protein
VAIINPKINREIQLHEQAFSTAMDEARWRLSICALAVQCGTGKKMDEEPSTLSASSEADLR